MATAAAALLSGCAAAVPIGHSELRLLGSWTGAADQAGNGVIEMIVTDAAPDGTTFDGELTFSTAGDAATEPVHAEMTPHGHLVGGVGDGASLEVHITDSATLDYCFVSYGRDFVYACGRLVRQDY